jgi:hypothetical protein
VDVYTEQHKQELEDIDQIFTKTLLQAKKLTAPVNKHCWSPEIQRLSNLYRYWYVSTRSAHHNISTKQQLLQLKTQIYENDIYQGNPQRNNKNNSN